MGRLYLVTGAGGYLGGCVVGDLLARGERVRALVMPGDPAIERLPRGVEIFEGDVRDLSSLEPFFSVVADDELYAVHAAGIVTIASKFDERVREVNVGGTANVIAMCEKHGVKKLVHVSSVHAIPELPRPQTISEVSRFDPGEVVGLYAKTKAEATQLALDAAARGLDVSVVHPSGMFGPGDYGRGYLKQLMIDYCSGGLTAGVRGGYDFADVRDVSAGILACLDRGRAGECYILSNRYIPVSELLDMMSDATGLRRVRTMLPMWFAKFTAPFAETYYKLLRQPPLYTSYSMYTLSGNARFSHEKATRELGYATRPFETTIADTFAWMCGNGMLDVKKFKSRKKTRVRGRAREGA